MKLMHSLPQQISITHTNGPHFRPRCRKGKQHTRKLQKQQEKKEIMIRLEHQIGDFMMSVVLKVLIAETF